MAEITSSEASTCRARGVPLPRHSPFSRPLFNGFMRRPFRSETARQLRTARRRIPREFEAQANAGRQNRRTPPNPSALDTSNPFEL